MDISNCRSVVLSHITKRGNCFQEFITTLRLHYNAVLYNTDPIITRSPRGSQIFFQYKYVKMSAEDRGIHNASSLCIS